MSTENTELNPVERLLVEGVRRMFDRKTLGLGDVPDGINDPANLGVQYLHAQIDDLFESKATELTHFDAVCSAFRKIHQYRNVTDNGFKVSFEADMKSKGVPQDERKKAAGFLPAIIKELADEESSYGYNENLDEIMEVSQPNAEE
jgi:hypothetical protein